MMKKERGEKKINKEERRMVHFFWAVRFVYMRRYTQDEDMSNKYALKKTKAEGEDKGELWLSAG